MGIKPELFVEKVDKNLFCSICHEVFQDPVSCKEGHTFCKECITKWLQNNQKCPLGNCLLTENQLVRVLIAKGIIDSLDVYCHPPPDTEEQEANVTNEEKLAAKKGEEKCDWRGNLGFLENHRETCPFQEVECPNMNCNEKMQRRRLKEHDMTCLHKNVKCEKCGLALLRKSLKNHLAIQCPEVLIPCPNHCTNRQEQINQMKRRESDAHIINSCAKTKVKCPFKEQGCLVQVERQYADKHTKDNMAKHMVLLAKKCSELTKDNRLLKIELNKVKEQLSKANSYTWTVRNFSTLCTERPNGFAIKSPIFWLCGHKLHIQMYPNGVNKDATEFLSLFLYISQEDNSLPVQFYETTVKYRLTLIGKYPAEDETFCEIEHLFTGRKNDSWGWPKFTKTTKALSKATNSNNDSLTIQCTILLDKPQ